MVNLFPRYFIFGPSWSDTKMMDNLLCYSGTLSHFHQLYMYSGAYPVGLWGYSPLGSLKGCQKEEKRRKKKRERKGKESKRKEGGAKKRQNG